MLSHLKLVSILLLKSKASLTLTSDCNRALCISLTNSLINSGEMWLAPAIFLRVSLSASPNFSRTICYLDSLTNLKLLCCINLRFILLTDNYIDRQDEESVISFTRDYCDNNRTGNASAGSNGNAPQDGQDWIITQDTHVWDETVSVKDIVVNFGKTLKLENVIIIFKRIHRDSREKLGG